MTMLEKAARAGWAKAQEQIPAANRLTDWDRVPDDAKKNFTDFVRAALTAIREPDAAMLAGCRGESEKMAVECWQFMVDAILEEKP